MHIYNKNCLQIASLVQYLLMQMTPASIACVQELVSCCAGHVNILGSNP